MAHTESLTVTTLWRDKESRQCHSKKEIEAAQAEGFHPYDAQEHEYPRWLYRGEESLIVANEEDEKAKRAQGFSRTPSINTGVIPDQAPSFDAPGEMPAVDYAILANHAAQISDLTARVAALEGKHDKKEKHDKK